MRRLLFLCVLVGAGPALADSSEALFARLPPVELPELGSEVIAFGQEFTLVLFGVTLAAETHDNRSAEGLADGQTDGADDVYFNAGLGLRYDRFLESEWYAYRILGEGAFRAGTADDVYAIAPRVTLLPRFKIFLNNEMPFFVHLQLDLDYRTTKVKDVDAVNQLAFRFGVGPGYGRVFDVGPRQRLIAVEKILRAAQLLDAEIPAETGDRILLHWYALRDAVGYYQHLGYALKLLSNDGLLRDEVDFQVAYKLLQTLRDPTYTDRRDGVEFWVDFMLYDEFITEQVFALGVLGYLEFGLPVTPVDQVLLNADFGVGMYNSERWRIGLDVLVENHLHNELRDPLGSIYYGALIDVESVAGDYSEVGYAIAGVFGYAQRFTRNLEFAVDALVGLGAAAMTFQAGPGLASGPWGAQERWFDQDMAQVRVDPDAFDADSAAFAKDPGEVGFVMLLRAGFHFGWGRGSFVIY